LWVVEGFALGANLVVGIGGSHLNRRGMSARLGNRWGGEGGAPALVVGMGVQLQQQIPCGNDRKKSKCNYVKSKCNYGRLRDFLGALA
jgi:hypothetical protein